MRKEALIGISVFLVMVSGSATVLNSFGVISGTADVEEPTFYADSGDNLITNPPEDASGNHQTLDNGAKFIFSNSDQWYPMTVDFVVEARFEEQQDNQDAKTKVIAKFGGEQNNCESRFDVTYSEDSDQSPAYDIYDANIENCELDNAPEGDLSLSIENAEDEPGAYVKYDGDTRVEVSSSE